MCGIVLVVESVYVSNVLYNNLQKRDEKTYATSIRLLDMVENAEGYNKGMPVIFIGTMDDSYPNPLQEYEMALQGYEKYTMTFLPFPTSSSYLWNKYIKDHLGVELRQPENYKILYEEISDSDWINELEIFPSKKCTEVYNGTLVVRIGSE